MTTRRKRKNPILKQIYHINFLLLQTTLASLPGFGAREKRPGDEVALASFDRSECRGTEVRDQTEIA